MSNIIDSIKVSGVTYEIQGSGGGITIDPTLDSGSTNPVANSAITTALDAKVNVADNEVSGLTLAFNIGARETYTIADNITKLTIKSTVSIGSGSRIVSFYIYHITGGSQINCSVKYTYQSNWINAINSTSGNFTATLNNGVIDITLDSGYYFFYINSINSFAVIGYKNYSGGQSARVIEGSVSEALSEVSVKIPPISVVDVDMYHGNNGTLNLERRYSSGTSWMNHSIPLNDEKTLKYDTYTGLYVNFKGQSAHTNTLNTDSGNYCYIPSVAASYDYAYDSFTVRANSGYTGSTASFTWTISGISEDGGAFANVYVYDKTSNTLTLTSRSFEVDVTQNGYYFTFTANNSQSPSDPIKLSQFREGNCGICGTGSTIPNAYIIDLVQALTYEYNGQEVIDDIYSKLDTKQTTLTAGTGISIIDNVISATGGGGGGVSESAFTAYTAATDSRIAEDEEVTAAALNALDEKIDNIDGTATVELTQAEYDALVTAGTVSADTYYIITDAQAGDLTNYYTKTETNTLLGGKADTATTYTKTEVDNAITGATSTKQDTLVSGTNIKTINNTSILGSGNIDIQGGGGGGKAIEAGRGISITTGETADTISLNEAISASTASSSTYIAIGSGAKAEAGYNAFLSNSGGIAIGSGATANRRDICIGNGAKGYNNSHSGLICIGLSSVSKQGGISIGINSEAYGEDGFDQFGGISIGFDSKTRGRNAIAIGYNTVASGTTKTNINNQLKIDTDNQIYIKDKTNTNEICLQDYLGGGGSSYTAGDGIDITNNVISVTGKVDTSAVTTSITSGSTDSEIPTAKAVYDATQSGGGGGTTYTAGRGIDITNDTISFNLPISAGTGTNSIRENGWNANTTASGNYSHAEGYGSSAVGASSHAEGWNTNANGLASHAEGQGTKSNNLCEHASGQYNVSSSASTTFGHSGNTLFSVGNGTADYARHNAFEVRQNGDIYITLNGQDVKLQDILLQLSGTTS